jgi:dienelactone hydrolase
VDFLHHLLCRKRTGKRANSGWLLRAGPFVHFWRGTAPFTGKSSRRIDLRLPIRFAAGMVLAHSPFAAPGARRPMRLLSKCALALSALVILGNQTPLPALGPQGAEGEPNREQQWLVPTPLADHAAHAVLFRPPGEGPFRLALIAHPTTQNVLRRAQMPQPEYRALAADLVGRGFAVLVPERLGHGATGGAYLEDQGGCDEADYVKSGRATAEQIRTALDFARGQSFIRKDGAVIIGHSAGGWGALALASEDPKVVAAIVAFAPGRGGHANDFENRICAPHTLLAAAATFGKDARVPVTWLVAANDTYFAPEFSRRLADAFRNSGGKVEFRALPAFRSEGHWLPETEAGVKLAAADLDRALKLDARPKQR